MGAENIFVISKARDKYIKKSKEVFEENKIYQVTGLFRHHMHFVHDYVDKRKICDKLKIDYMIDDSIKVIRCLLDSKITTAIWFGDKVTDEFESTGNVVSIKSLKILRKWLEKTKK